MAVVFAYGSATAVFAIGGSASSDSYQITEMQFGGGSSLESCSDSYCARSNIDSINGNSFSQNNQSTDGSTANDIPGLEVSIDAGQSNLGVFDTQSTSVKTSVIHIKSYLSDGYNVQIIGEPPTYDGYSLSALATPTVSTPGVEQFGINLVANTTPSMGVNPLMVPSQSDALATVASGYDTPNLFKYTSGDTVAQGVRSNERVDYTLSMIVNVSSATPAGSYTGDYAVVVTPTY